MIKLIVGLGNPGQQYEKTRHNVGFLFLDELIKTHLAFWANESKFHGVVANINIGGEKVIFLKPQTFMNRCGLAVSSVARYYKIKTEEILIIHDELDMDAGMVKLKKGGGHAGHNGLRNIIDHLGGNSFYRIRLGIGRPVSRKPVADYVLSNPSKEDQALIFSAMEQVETQIQDIVAGHQVIVMNKLNKA